MADKTVIILCIISVFGFGLTITTLVLAIKIRDKTKDNPLEEYDKKVENLFDDDDNTIKTENTIVEYTTIVSDKLRKLSKYCQCGEKILDNICTEEQIVSGCYDVSKNKNNFILRYLKENCDTIGEKIINEGGFSQAFDLNYDTVYITALIICITLILPLTCVVYSIIFCCFSEISGICLLIALFGYPLSLLINFISLIIMIVSYYKGKTGEFLDFYEDCLKGEDKPIDLQKTYKKLNNINKYILAFVIINFLHYGFSIAEVFIIFRKYKESKK